MGIELYFVVEYVINVFFIDIKVEFKDDEEFCKVLVVGCMMSCCVMGKVLFIEL